MSSATLKRFRDFTPPGPVTDAFLQDRTSLVRALRGPVGGGKTVTCVFDHVANASQMPICTDGTIRFRLAVIGTTYAQLERNLYPTWKEWLPADGRNEAGSRWTEAEFSGGGGRYAKHEIKWAVERAGHRIPVHFEAIFSAIGEQSVEQFMRGFEPTAFWLFEMDLLPASVLDLAVTRIGRYPRREHVWNDVPYRAYVVGDLNSPDVDSWFYRKFEEDRPRGFAHYAQPSGLSPQAENIANLPRDYYQRQVEMLRSNPNLVKRFVLNEYAPSSDGQPVYPEYSDDRHLAPGDLAPVKGVPVYLGIDAGLRAPAAVIFQNTRAGQFRMLGEVVPGRVGTKSFAACVRREMAEVAPGFDIERAYCDPAGFSGSASEDDQLAWAETLMVELGCTIEPTWTNNIDVRHDAVRDELTSSLDDGSPAFVIARRCKSLRKGFASHYRYAKRRQASTDSLTPKPEKNDWSHVHDAAQYGVLGVKGQFGTVASKTSKAARRTGAAPAACATLKNTTRVFG